jgi:hypothetical protein
MLNGLIMDDPERGRIGRDGIGHTLRTSASIGVEDMLEQQDTQ